MMNKLTEIEQMHVFTSFPENAQDEDTAKLLDDTTTNKESEQKNHSFYEIEYYQKYFNVSTTNVLHRIFGSMIPRLNNNYLMQQIRPNPDLYGPFWVSITLIFTIAISGNIVNLFQTFGQDRTWHTDFHKVTSSAAVILLYWWCVPTLLYFAIRWRGNPAEYSFIEILCIYGYSLSIYIPVSILWLIQISALQWILLIIAVLLSGSVLLFTIFPAFSNDKINIYGPIMLMIIILHAVIAIGFMLYFFHVSPNNNENKMTTLSTLTTVIAKNNSITSQ